MVLYFFIQLSLTLSLILLFLLVFGIVELFKFDFISTLIISIFLTYLLAIFLLASINKVSRVLMRTKEGEIDGIGLILWTIQATSLDIAMTLTHKFLIHPLFPDVLYRFFGFKRRKGVSIITRIWDPDLIDIGENTLIGTEAILSGHHIRQGKLYRKRLKIGKNVTIGARSIIAPGVTVGDNTVVAISSTVPPGWTLDANCLYGGVPVKKLKSLKQNNHESEKDLSEGNETSITAD